MLSIISLIIALSAFALSVLNIIIARKKEQNAKPAKQAHSRLLRDHRLGDLPSRDSISLKSHHPFSNGKF